MRSSGTPSTSAAITRRTAARTSSSGSDAETTSVPCGGVTGPAPGPWRWRSRPRRATTVAMPASARSTPVMPATTVSDAWSATACRSAAPGIVRSCGRYNTERAEVGEHGAALAYCDDRGVHQVALVVPRSRERGTGGAVHAHDLGRSLARARETVERGVVALRQFAVRVDECLLRGGMLRDRAEHAGLAREHSAHRCTQHRRGHRPATGRCEPRCTKHLGDAVHREERDARDADAAVGDLSEHARPEHAPCRHPHVVRGDDDAHRGERIIVLADGHRVARTPARRRGRRAR